jgi:hypothetical protein
MAVHDGTQPAAVFAPGVVCYGPGMLPVVVKPPNRWPQRIFAIGGAICVLGAVLCWFPLSDAKQERDRIEATLKQYETRPEAAEATRALLAAHRDARAVVARWHRRTLGLALTAAVLLAGALFAAGLRRLHERIHWAFVDDTTQPKEGP